MEKQYDVIVCGGGVAGTCAAIAAAGKGAKVLILEQLGCLGGTWTAGLVSWFIDVANKEGYIINEIMSRLADMGAGHFARDNCFLCEPEALKYLLDTMCAEKQIDVRFYTTVFDVIREERYLKAVKTVSKSGIETFFGGCFIDATGDGDVCALCKVSFSKGNEKGQMQPMTLFALIDGPEYEQMIPFDNALPYIEGEDTPKIRLKKEIERAGMEPSQKAPAMYRVFNNTYLLTVNHEYEKDGTNADSLTDATIRARAEIHRIVEALRKLGGVWENLRLVSTAQMIGVRESRRILGRYTVTRKDVEDGAKFDDAICKISSGIDIHALNEQNPTGFEAESDAFERDYQIPLRAAVCEGMENLLMAGRCISGDFYAHASYRVTGNMAVVGENVGKYAVALQRVL